MLDGLVLYIIAVYLTTALYVPGLRTEKSVAISLVMLGIGDAGYSCRPYLLTPLQHPDTAAERRYNYAQSKTRTVIERTFGLWEKRFQCLRNKLQIKVERSLVVITATAVLHKFLLARHDVQDLDGEGDDNGQVVNEGNGGIGLDAGRAIIKQHFTR